MPVAFLRRTMLRRLCAIARYPLASCVALLAFIIFIGACNETAMPIELVFEEDQVRDTARSVEIEIIRVGDGLSTCDEVLALDRETLSPHVVARATLLLGLDEPSPSVPLPPEPIIVVARAFDDFSGGDLLRLGCSYAEPNRGTLTTVTVALRCHPSIGRCVDGDNDGIRAEHDCDDTDRNAFPGARELCDQKDNDCDKEIDEECCTPRCEANTCAVSDGCGGTCSCDANFTCSDGRCVTPAAAQPIVRVSMRELQLEANDGSFWPTISGDGRYVAFSSRATNLVSDDTNGVTDVFLVDRGQGTLRRVGLGGSDHSIEGNDHSIHPAISPSGRYVAFSSASRNWGPLSVIKRQVYLFDQSANETTRISSSAGNAFEAADGDCDYPSLSEFGDIVAFESNASNLVDEPDNGQKNVFIYDAGSRQTERIPNPDQEPDTVTIRRPSVSRDGLFVAFELHTTDRTEIYLHSIGLPISPLIVTRSVDGSRADQASSTPRVAGSGQITDLTVAFESSATNLIESMRITRTQAYFFRSAGIGPFDPAAPPEVSLASQNELDQPADATARYPDISAYDGRYVVFVSKATNLSESTGASYPGPYDDVFVTDNVTGTVARVSRGPQGEPANGDSGEPRISADGRFIVFSSYASNLVDDDMNERADIFVAANPLFEEN